MKKIFGILLIIFGCILVLIETVMFPKVLASLFISSDQIDDYQTFFGLGQLMTSISVFVIGVVMLFFGVRLLEKFKSQRDQ